MAISQAMCTLFKKDVLLGDHHLDSDSIYIALYTSSASLGAATAGYGLGYDSGTDRWALDADLAHNATNIVPDAYVGIVQYDTTAGDSYAAPIMVGQLDMEQFM